MKLYEYQAKKLLEDFQIPVQNGQIAFSPDEASAIAGKMKGKVVIKAQVLTGGRGKAGGVRIVSGAQEAWTASEAVLNKTIKDIPVRKVLITPAVDIMKEFYVSILVNSGDKRIDCIICKEGGMEIEEIARSTPELIHKIPVSPEILRDKKRIIEQLSKIFDPEMAELIFPFIGNMFDLFIQKDCSLVEINPLALDKAGNLTALDAKIVIDDNALFKHPELSEFKNPEEYSPDELDAKKAGLAFVSLQGRIGCMVNGAGLAMATMDLIKYFGEEPANFLDIGGSSNPQKVIDGFKILLRNKNIKAILLNIFGGITRCDDIARGLVEAEKEFRFNIPLVIRLIGTNDREGIEILLKNGFTAFSSLTEAVKAVVNKV